MPSNEPLTTLVVTRKNQEAVTIGDGIRVQVMTADGHQARVRLRITAPRSMRILREELKPT